MCAVSASSPARVRAPGVRGGAVEPAVVVGCRRGRGREVGEQGEVEVEDELEARRDDACAPSPRVACIPKNHSIYVQYTLCCLQSDYPITVGCSAYVSM